MPTSVRPRSRTSGGDRREQRTRRGQHGRGVPRRPQQGVRPGGAGEVVEAHPDHDRAADPLGLAQPAAHAIDERDERGVDLGRRTAAQPERALRPDRAAPPPDGDRPRVAVVGQRVQVPPRPRPEHRHERALLELGDLADGEHAALVQLRRRHLAHAPELLHRQRVQEAELALGRDVEQAVGLRDPARHLGQELGAGRPDGDGEPDLVAHRGPQPDPDLDRRAAHLPEAADVEERLVDRDAFDERRRVVEDREDGPAGLDVGLEPWRHDDRLRAQLASLATAHGRAHAERLGLVAGGQDHAGADDHRAPPQLGVVALLDRRVERVQVGMQDHELMFY